jgi:hypothetical protein
MSGWEDLDSAPPKAVPKEINDVDKLCLRVFGTEEGQKLLKWLREQTIEVACWLPGAEASYGYFHEGRCNLVKEIETRVQRARNPT